MKILFLSCILILQNVVLSQSLLHPWSSVDVSGTTATASGLRITSSAGNPVSATDTAGSFLLLSGFLFGNTFHTGTYIVTNTNPSGPGSLKQAILNANQNPEHDVIYFNIAPGGFQTIQLDSVLPEISAPITIDGTSQPGYTGIPLIEIDGANAGVRPFDSGGILLSADNSVIKGLIINRFATDGLVLDSVRNVVIENCYIGISANGMSDAGNTGTGIVLRYSSHNRIGDSSTAGRNIISGNDGGGIWITGDGSDSNSVIGNYIGLNAIGTASVGNNLFGITIDAGIRNTVGGESVAGMKNIISGNQGDGIYTSFAAVNTIIGGNYVGTSANGRIDLGNTGNGINVHSHNSLIAGNVSSGNELHGIQIIQARDVHIEHNFVGTNIFGDSLLGNTLHGIFTNSFFDTARMSIYNNIVCSNGGDGIHMANVNTRGCKIQANSIGTTLTHPRLGNAGNGIATNAASFQEIGGVVPGDWNTIAFNGQHGILISNTGTNVENSIRGNAIYGNGALGIKLGSLDYFPTLNDSLDVDDGPNRSQNFPMLNVATYDSTSVHIEGTLHSYPNAQFTIEFFSNDTADTSGYGEGAYYLGNVVVTTDNAGNASFSVNVDFANRGGNVVTATATDSAGNTSEFSASRTLQYSAAPTLSIKHANIVEGNSGTTTVNISVDLVPSTIQTVTVHFSTRDSSATLMNGDYRDTSGVLTFSPNEEQKVISITVFGDTLIERNEVFSIRLFNPTNASITDSIGYCIIVNDDSIYTNRYLISEGWNLLSLPVSIDNRSRSFLFPQATTSAYTFGAESTYIIQDTLNDGIGYWMNFATADTITLRGRALDSIFIPVHQGWNLIGSISSTILTNQLTSNPPAMNTSQLFRYQGSYVQSDSIVPGNAYWIKTSHSGMLKISSGTMPDSMRIVIVPTNELPPSPPSILSIGDKEKIPTKFDLLQNFPNPFNPTTTIRYELPIESHVTLTLFNILGQQVSAPVHGEIQQAGYREVKIDGTKLASGIYFYRLTARPNSGTRLDNFISIKRMLLVK